MRQLFFFCCLMFVSNGIFAQKQATDTLVLTKGRNYTSLYGTLSNQQVEVGSGESLSTTGYTIGTQSGHFIKNNWIIGLDFSLSKSEFSNDEAILDTEELLIGPWTRFYFGHKGGAALYAEITPNYTSIFRKNIVKNIGGSPVIIDEEVNGGGFGIIPGIGFTYLINRNVGFGMTLSYSLAWLKIDTKDILLDTVTSDSYDISKFQFGFNFQVYLDQFFF